MAPPLVRPQTEVEAEFAALKGEVDMARRPKAGRTVWISQATCNLLYRRTELQREGRAISRVVQKERSEFQSAL